MYRHVENNLEDDIRRREHTEGENCQTYGNRLALHVRPSLDYSFFSSALDSRIAKRSGTIKEKSVGHDLPCLCGRRLITPSTSISEYLDAVAAMLQA